MEDDWQSQQPLVLKAKGRAVKLDPATTVRFEEKLDDGTKTEDEFSTVEAKEIVLKENQNVDIQPSTTKAEQQQAAPRSFTRRWKVICGAGEETALTGTSVTLTEEHKPQGAQSQEDVAVAAQDFPDPLKWTVASPAALSLSMSMTFSMSGSLYVSSPRNVASPKSPASGGWRIGSLSLNPVDVPLPWEGAAVGSVRGTCDECETPSATLRCEACEETLCPACCRAMHPNDTIGSPHEHVTEGAIRPLRRDDPLGPSVADAAHISEWPITEDEWACVHDTPKAVCGAAGAVTDGKGKPRREGIRFRANDIVVFDFIAHDELAPLDDSLLPPACKPPWRDPQGYGLVVSLASDLLAPGLPAMRRGDNCEIYYVVEFTDYVVGDYSSLCAEQERAESQAGDGLHVNVTGGSLSCCEPDALAAAERDAWQLQKKLRNARARVDFLAQGSRVGQKDEHVVCMPESRLSDPRQRQHAYSQAKKTALQTLMTSTHNRAMRFRARIGLERLIKYWRECRTADMSAAAVKVQTCFRRHNKRNLLDVLRRERDHRRYLAGRELHKDFQYIPYDVDVTYAYTVNGVDFFSSHCDLNKWFRVRHVYAGRMLTRLREKFTDDIRYAFRLLQEHAKLGRKPHIVEDPDDLRCRTPPDALKVDRHPAHGFHRPLPPLTAMWAAKANNGEISVKKATRFNSFVASHAGPTDWSAWVIKDMLLMGRTPLGRATRASLYKLAAERIVAAGVSTFVCMLTEDERRAAEKVHNVDSLEDEVKWYHRKTREHLVTAKLRAEERCKALAYDIDLLTWKRVDEETIRAKTVKLRVADRVLREAQSALARVGAGFTWLNVPMKAGHAGDLNETMGLVYDIEKRIREGQRVYVFSEHGHGRPGVVCGIILGRIYALPVEETLMRLQFYHDCAVGLRGAGFGKGYSCPTTMQQAQRIREGVSLRESEYEPMVTMIGPPLDPFRRRLIQQWRRRHGYPKLEPDVYAVDEDIGVEIALAQRPDDLMAQSNIGRMLERTKAEDDADSGSRALS